MFLKVYQDKTRGEVNFLSKVTVKVHKFKRQPHKMVKHTQLFVGKFPTNCLSVFDHFVGFSLKGLTHYVPIFGFISMLSNSLHSPVEIS